MNEHAFLAEQFEQNRTAYERSSSVDAAISAGVGRVVQESVSMIYPDRGASGWIPMYPSAREGWIATAETLQDR